MMTVCPALPTPVNSIAAPPLSSLEARVYVVDMSNPGHHVEDPTPPDAAAGDAPMDQVSSQPEQEPDEEQNAPLPDWGPTDGVHGTDAESSE
jgi:hypothetical protein